jgi:hypothetical protein
VLLKPVAAVALVLLACSSVAAENSVEFKTTYYAQTDSDASFGKTRGDDNTDVNEESTVIEPIVLIKYDLTARTNISLQIDADFISSASIDRLGSPPVTNQGGATGDKRFGVKTGISHRFEFADVRGSVGFSSEYEYSSASLSGGFSKELLDRQATLSIDISFYGDEVDVIDRTGVEPGGETRQSFNVDLGWSQILTSRSQLDLNVSLSLMQGFLQTAYHRVYLDVGDVGIEVDEVVPDQRLRTAIGASYKRFFDAGLSLHVGERLYRDDWGIVSSTTSLEFYAYLVPESIYAGFRYRFYLQTAADFYEDRGQQFSIAEARAVAEPGRYTGFERSNDPDLGDFTSHTVGLSFGFTNLKSLGTTGELTISLDYMVRDDGLEAYWAMFGYRFEY